MNTRWFMKMGCERQCRNRRPIRLSAGLHGLRAGIWISVTWWIWLLLTPAVAGAEPSALERDARALLRPASLTGIALALGAARLEASRCRKTAVKIRYTRREGPC